MRERLLPEYAYTLPEELIAHTPSSARDESRLFVYDTKTDAIQFDVFKNLAIYLPKDSIIILNDTKVVPAFIRASIQNKKEQRLVDLLFLVNEINGNSTTGLALSHNKISQKNLLRIGNGYTCGVIGREGEAYVVRCNAPIKEILEAEGKTPTPPYIRKELSEEVLRKRYQSIVAAQGSSVAAPTASLHFTKAVFKTLEKKSIHKYCATLNVGMGTFSPVRQEHLDTNTLHMESYVVPRTTVSAIRDAHVQGKKITAVGTTMVRTLESISNELLNANIHSTDIVGSTNIFIRPGFTFHIVDHLLTNFHVPESSLMSLVEAFLVSKNSKRGLVELYRVAIEEKFRFYSFGDVMLII